MYKKLLTLTCLLIFHVFIYAQSIPFEIHIEPIAVSGLGGLQSYAFGQHNGKWLIIGGRLDGLHRRQPFAAFDIAGNNNQLIVVDPTTLQKWSAPLTSLSTDLKEQLSSTNMEFYQNENYLYVVGGYGYHAASASKKTFDFITAIDVPAVINSIITGASLTPYFRQITDPQFAVTGGHLKKINNTFYLVGGHRFDGDYHPMGNSSFTQVYTNAIRKFNLTDNGTQIIVTHLPEITDAVNLHRRDFNVIPQIMPNGSEGLTAFSGVFQPTVNLPFLNCVNIDSTAYEVNNTFEQHYNHYHCAVLPLFSILNNQMYNVFFGGIAQFYVNSGVLIQDDNVPFVNTIACVIRDENGIMTEYKLPAEMPAYLGAGAEFIPLVSAPHYDNHVINLDNLSNDTTLIGYIYGGISSTAPNIFFTNTGSQSSASSQIYKVFVIKNTTVGFHELNGNSISTLNLQVFPNPNDGNFEIQFYLDKVVDIKLLVYSNDGRKIDETKLTNLKTGVNSYQFKLKNSDLNGVLLLTIDTPTERTTQKIVIKQ
ncbi:MAG: T9SS type A sorting domain-containing protein [Sphingobacteriales bacterium]|nr:MAG: T9SS type A sorting domain-containing protein [Sphingobacteriales bacterium]